MTHCSAPDIPRIPPGAHEVTASLALRRDGTRVVFFNAGSPIFSRPHSDRLGLRRAAVNVVEQGRAGATAGRRPWGCIA
jgi:phosphoserine phosphatase